MGTRPRRQTIGLGMAVFSFAFILRALFLEADPPDDLSWSLSPFLDGPMAMTPARLAVQGSQGLSPEHTHGDANPFISLVLTGVMSLLGAGLWQGRIIFVLAGSASCALLYVVLLGFADKWTSALAGFFLAINYIFVQYNRLAMEETLVIFFGLAGLAVARFGQSGAARTFLGGTLLSVGGLLIKLHGLLFILVFVLTSLAVPGSSPSRTLFKRLIHRCWPLAGGILLVWMFAGLAGLKPAYPPLGQYFIAKGQEDPSGLAGLTLSQNEPGRSGDSRWPDLVERAVRTVRDLPGRYLTIGLGTRLFSRMPVLTALSLALLISFFSNLKGSFSAQPTLTLFAIWLLAGIFTLGLLRYRPLRYELLLVPPMCALAAVALSNLVRATPEGAPLRSPGIGCFIGLIPFVYQGSYRACEAMVGSGLRLPGLGPDDFPAVLIWPHWLVSVFVAAVVGALVIARFLSRLFTWMSPWWRSLEPGIRWSITVTMILGSIAVQISHYFRSYELMKYDTLAASRDLRDVIAPGSVVAGALADAVTIETKYPSCTYSNFQGDIDKVLERCPDATHLITSVSNLPALNWRGFQSLRSKSLVPICAHQIGPRRRFLVISGQLKASRVLEIVFRIHKGKPITPTAFERAVMHLLDGNEASAQVEFRRFLEDHPRHLPTLLQLASLAARSSDRSSAYKQYLDKCFAQISQDPRRTNEHEVTNIMHLQHNPGGRLIP